MAGFRRERNFTDNKSIAGNMPNPKKARIVKNMAQPDSKLGDDTYMTKSIGTNPKTPGKPLPGTLGGSFHI